MTREYSRTTKRNKAAKARNRYHNRQRVLHAIENSEHYVPEDAHLEYFANVPEQNVPDLCIEVEKSKSSKAVLTGNRIVDIAFFIEQMQTLVCHDRTCIFGKMTFSHETRNGLVCHITFHCSACDREIEIKTQRPNCDINNSFVWGVSSIGSGYSQTEELLSVIDMPMMTKRTYKKIEQTVSSKWEELLTLEMQANAKEEKKMAEEAGDVEQGVPFITVVVDGGWSKRSYGHSYSSLSGVACIIGQRTKKLLYIGIKNKFCYVCATSKTEHNCYKNYSGSSTSMEQSIIVEGFNRSEKDYGIRYKYVVGDGDSSVYTRILGNVIYGRYVVKLECANHVTRALTSNLYKLVKNTQYDVTARNLIKSRIPRFSMLIRTIIARTPDVNNLRRDLHNAPLHIFDDHDKCRSETCDKVSNKSNIKLLESANMLPEIIKICYNVERKADRLCKNVTTNYAERFMSLVAKFTGGKRINIIQRGVYQSRCIGAGLLYNLGPSFHKLSTKKPKLFLEKFCKNRQLKKTFQRKKSQKNVTFQDDDMDYGPNSAQPDVKSSELEDKKCKVMQELANENVSIVEETTRGQRENISWHQARRNRLTASSFGKICLRRNTTPCHNLIKDLFYRSHDIRSKSMQYGIDNESTAIGLFQRETGINVKNCGFFISPDYCFLGASPDGVTEDNGIVEVKCLFSIRHKKIKEALNETKNLCVKLTSSDELALKENHHYYFQIQGQLNICGKEICYLILYTTMDLQYIKVKRNETLWKDIMLPKLKQFWEHCALPELADPRIPRGLKARDPDVE